ncbi:MAG: class I SAM-dependent methyltransferase, partial [Rikenellaceae bacterium]|nr:class I SAM-dependent methyltransferase [Rikenellaceae bacterium]
MFNRIAPTYDKLNHIMSMNIDRRWRKRAMALVAACSPREVLDL